MENSLYRAVEHLKSKRIIDKDIDIAEKLDVSKSAVSNYLSGRIKPSANFIARFEIAILFGLQNIK